MVVGRIQATAPLTRKRLHRMSSYLEQEKNISLVYCRESNYDSLEVNFLT